MLVNKAIFKIVFICLLGIVNKGSCSIHEPLFYHEIRPDSAHGVELKAVGNIKRWLLLKSIDHKHQNKKSVAIALAIALGPFGVHRLYLGTSPKVPVAYTLTLGGGLGILPVADIIAILSTPNLEKYENNQKVIMFVK